METARRTQVRRAVEERLEAKRQKMFAAMTPEDRKFFRHYDLATLIALKHGSITGGFG